MSFRRARRLPPSRRPRRPQLSAPLATCSAALQLAVQSELSCELCCKLCCKPCIRVELAAERADFSRFLSCWVEDSDFSYTYSISIFALLFSVCFEQTFFLISFFVFRFL